MQMNMIGEPFEPQKPRGARFVWRAWRRVRAGEPAYIAMIAAVLLLIGAFGRNDDGAIIESAPVATVGEQIAALPESERNAIFIRAIRDAGQECQLITSSRTGSSYRGMPTWDAACLNGRHRTLFIAEDATAQMLNADETQLAAGQSRANAVSDATE